jgi:hypothetical protein
MYGGGKMFIINKPKYRGSASNRNEINQLIEDTKRKYINKYPNSKVTIHIEPDPDCIEYDGSMKEFTYKAVIEYHE